MFNVAFADGTYEVACPQESKAGDTIRIRLPRKEPTPPAPAAPAAAAPPVAPPAAGGKLET